MKEIGRSEVQDKLSSQRRPFVVEVLPSERHADYHLPGAISIPLGDDFEERFERAVPDKDAEVIVYCSDQDCSASPRAAQRLQRYGYSNILDYAAGKQDWRQAGLPIERGENP